MRILEVRGKIKNIEEARNIAEKIGGVYKGFYYTTDIIFKHKNTDSEKGVIVLRTFKTNSRPRKKYSFVHKIAKWSDKTKTDKVVLHKRFNTMEEVVKFMIDHYGEVLKEDYEYSREGCEYNLEKCDIFIECIQMLGPTIEVEADTKSDLESILKHFEVEELFSESTPEIMRKLVK